MDKSYTREKLRIALQFLVRAGPLRKRLRLAFYSLHTLTPNDFPVEDARARLDELVCMLTSGEPKFPDESVVYVSTRDMTNAQAQRAANLIVELMCDLTRDCEAQGPNE